MSDFVVRKGKSPVLLQLLILVLLAAVLTLSLLSAYKYFVKAPTVTPQELEIKGLSERVANHPEDKVSRLLLAYEYQKAKEYDNAIEQYKAVLKNNPRELAALYNLGVIAKEQKNVDKAEDYFKKVIRVKNSHVLALVGLSEIYLTQERYDKAIETLDKVLEVQQHLATPRYLKAQALEKKGDKASAVLQYQEVLKYVPDHKEALAALERLQ